MNSSGSQNLIEALIQLLEEEEERYEIVRQKLIEIGPPALPSLTKWVAKGSPRVSERARDVLESIRLEALDDEWQNYVLKEPCPLEEGVFLLARFGNPSIDPQRYREKLNQMAKTVRDRTSAQSDPYRTIQIFNDYLFKELKFSGNRLQYYIPENSYIDTLLDLKKGIPISLSVLVLLLSERLHFPIYGVGMPGHFLIAWSDPQHEIYIDPFNQGRILTRDEIEAFLTEGGLEFKEDYLKRASSRQIIARMIRNLIHIYTHEGDVEKAAWLGRFFERVRLSIE